LENSNKKNKVAVNKKRRTELFEEGDMTMSRDSMWLIFMTITLPSSYIQTITRERALLKGEGLL